MGPQPPYPVSSHFRPGQGQRPGPAPHGTAPYGPGPYGQPPREAAAYGSGIPYGSRPPAAGPRPLATTATNPRHVLVAGGSMVALAALLITPNLDRQPQAAVESFSCVKIEKELNQALISRDQIRKLVATEPQAAKSTVQDLLSTPYCVMAPAKTEAGITADREAYPLEFDPQTWLVVLYEGDRYLGYDFRFR